MLPFLHAGRSVVADRTRLSTKPNTGDFCPSLGLSQKQAHCWCPFMGIYPPSFHFKDPSYLYRPSTKAVTISFHLSHLPSLHKASHHFTSKIPVTFTIPPQKLSPFHFSYHIYLPSTKQAIISLQSWQLPSLHKASHHFTSIMTTTFPPQNPPHHFFFFNYALSNQWHTHDTDASDSHPWLKYHHTIWSSTEFHFTSITTTTFPPQNLPSFHLSHHDYLPSTKPTIISLQSSQLPSLHKTCHHFTSVITTTYPPQNPPSFHFNHHNYLPATKHPIISLQLSQNLIPSPHKTSHHSTSIVAISVLLPPPTKPATVIPDLHEMSASKTRTLRIPEL